jgi:hypothetical protein
MIPSKQTNTVYLSELLHFDKRFKETCDSLIKLLNKHGIEHKFLKATHRNSPKSILREEML